MMLSKKKNNLEEIRRWKKREKEEKKKEDNLLNDCKFLKAMLPKLVIAKFDAIYFDCVKIFL